MRKKLWLSFYSPDLVTARMDDPDSSVIVRMCRLFYDLWQLHLHESEQHKRSRTDNCPESGDTSEYISLFYTLKGDYWIIEAVRHSISHIIYHNNVYQIWINIGLFFKKIISRIFNIL